MKHIQTEVESFARIRVVGVGGSGGNTINHMIDCNVKGVEFIAINTDAQDLHRSRAKKKIHIGKNLTRGLGAGGYAEVGRRAGEETQEEILESLKGSDMVFIAGGMGGGTGTGASPIIARLARETGALTVGVVTRPFGFEGQQRMRAAEGGIEELKKEVDALIVIPNDRLLAVVSRDTTVTNAFAMCDDILRQAVEGITELITTAGIINVDFADIRSVLQSAGSALMGIGVASGEKRAEEAAMAAINSPLLEISIQGAKGVLFAIAGGDDLGMLEIQDAARIITESIDPNARVIFGAVKDERLKKNELKVTVIATGFPDDVLERPASLFAIPSRHDPETETDEGKIHHSSLASSLGLGGRSGRVDGNDEEQRQRTHAPSDTKPAVPEEKKSDNTDDDDDDWTVPSFLRRSKIK